MVEGSVRRTIFLSAVRAKVWGALTTPDDLAMWLGEVLEFEPRAGAPVVVRDPDGSMRRGLVEAVEVERSLVLRWRRLAGAGTTLEVGPATRVEFTLEDEAGGTRLTVTEEPTPMIVAEVTS
jgi:uncharacterized protein YndB with AHSA1/START domain